WNPTLGAGIGLLTDQPDQQFFASTIQEELLYSLHGLQLKPQEAQRRVRDSLVAVGLDHDDASLRQSPFTLSGGQKRRLALAAALMLEPSWLLLDEPSVGLDAAGIHQLADKLQVWPERGGGVLIATHDAAAFWSIASQILVLDRGRVVFFGAPAEIVRNPAILRKAGLGVPAGMEVVERLRDKGLMLPEDMLTPEQLATVLAERLGVEHEVSQSPDPAELVVAQTGTQPEARPPDLLPSTLQETSIVKHARLPPISGWARGALPESTPSPTNSLPTPGGPLGAFDPRAVWVFLLAVTIGIWQQTDWFGLFVGTVLTLVIVLYSRISLRTLMRLSRVYAMFLLFTIVLAGMGWTHAGPLLNRMNFDWEQAAVTLTRLYRLYLVLWLGFLLPLTQSQLRIKRVLEQSLRPFARIGLPVEAFSLTTSLLFRFIPLIQGEWQRFGQLARIKRRAMGRTDRLAIRDLRPLLVPFLLSLLRLADQVAYALEARGYARTGGPRTHAITFHLAKKDVLLMLCGVLLAIGLYVFARG
ncbi:MAG: ATP-binding cassette domain-containing protein, partial [Gorillibacterium sp.]|nr:ATP-binding cassette domain-containing protein [Gorillibacterium sp.]